MPAEFLIHRQTLTDKQCVVQKTQIGVVYLVVCDTIQQRLPNFIEPIKTLGSNSIDSD